MTPERIRRHDDERLYQPRIHSRWIRALYRAKLETGEPMTVLLEKALVAYLVASRERIQNEMDGDAFTSDQPPDGDS